jgi:site-specific recombinase XerD
VENYVRALRDLQHHHQREADGLDRDEILAFLAHRDGQVGKSTLNIISCGLKYYYGRVLGDLSRIVDFPTPRKPRQLGELLTTDELRQLLGAGRSLRHRLVLELLFGLGLRAAEVGRLRTSDFDRASRSLTVRHGKGGKTRLLPYGGRLRDTLNAYYRAKRPTHYLIPGGANRNEPFISVRGVQYIVSQARRRSGLRKACCPHTLRHCFAVHYLEQGGNLIRLQQLLGHAEIGTTLRYLSYACIPLADIASPLDRLYGD